MRDDAQLFEHQVGIHASVVWILGLALEVLGRLCAARRHEPLEMEETVVDFLATPALNHRMVRLAVRGASASSAGHFVPGRFARRSARGPALLAVLRHSGHRRARAGDERGLQR